MEARQTILERRPFTEVFPTRRRAALVATGGLSGLALGALAGGRVALGTGWLTAVALVGLLAGVAASWSP